MVANKVLTLLFVRNNSRLLLGYKKTGFGEGRWNGFGGKVEKGETIEAAAKRELTEECGLTAQSMHKLGMLMFEFVGKPQLLEVHVFSTNHYSGTPTESDEMRPEWFDIDKIPYSKMWTDDKYWFPYMLKGQKFYGYFTFTDMVNIQDYTLKQVDTLDGIEIPQGCQANTKAKVFDYHLGPSMPHSGKHFFGFTKMYSRFGLL